jgi:hypothetical protein
LKGIKIVPALLAGTPDKTSTRSATASLPACLDPVPHSTFVTCAGTE